MDLVKVSLEDYLEKEDFLMLFKACLFEITSDRERLVKWFDLLEDLSMKEVEQFKDKVFFREGFMSTTSKSIEGEEFH